MIPTGIIKGYELITIFIEVLIVLTYGVAVIFNILFLIKTQWRLASFVKLWTTIACAIFTAMYIYAIVRILTGHAIDTNTFGAVIVRPAILFMGFGLLLSAAFRYISLQKVGGESWKLRNS